MQIGGVDALLFGRGHRQSPRCEPRRCRREHRQAQHHAGSGFGPRGGKCLDHGAAADLDAVAGLQYQFSRPSLFTFSTPLEVVVSGYDLDRLRGVAEQVRARMDAAGTYTDIRSTVEAENPEIQIVFDQDRATRLGSRCATSPIASSPACAAKWRPATDCATSRSMSWCAACTRVPPRSRRSAISSSIQAARSQCP